MSIGQNPCSINRKKIDTTRKYVPIRLKVIFNLPKVGRFCSKKVHDICNKDGLQQLVIHLIMKLFTMRVTSSDLTNGVNCDRNDSSRSYSKTVPRRSCLFLVEMAADILALYVSLLRI